MKGAKASGRVGEALAWLERNGSKAGRDGMARFGLKDEFGKRAAFALLWGLTVHDKVSGDAPFLKALRLVERAAADERHFVKKAVNMALRAVGKRSPALNKAAVGAMSPRVAPRWPDRYVV